MPSILLKSGNVAFFRKSLLLAAGLAVIVTPLQIYLGDGSMETVFWQNNPPKGAAIEEGHWNTGQEGQPAAWVLVAWPDKAEQRNDWQLTIPGALSAACYRLARRPSDRSACFCGR